MTDYENNGVEILNNIKEGKLIDSFDKVWEKIGGDNKSYTETLETLWKEISHRERLGSELNRKQDFVMYTKVQQETDAFVQTQYGFQDTSYHGGIDESDIWKAARAKGIEVQDREKADELDMPHHDIYPGHSPVFYGTASEDREAYFESHKINVECAKKLEKSLGDNFSGNHLDIDGVLSDMKEYSSERIAIVVANTMKLRDGDSRFSSSNREWAENVKLPESSTRASGEYLATSHSVKVDHLVKKFREREISQSRETANMTEQREAESSQEHETPQAQESMVNESSVHEHQSQGPNMTEVQAAEMKASVVQGLSKSADGLSRVEGLDIGHAEEEYVLAAGQVKYEAQRARTADGEIKGRGSETQRPLENPQVGQRVMFQPRENDKVKLTGKVVAADEHTVTLKCGGKNIPAIRSKGDFFEAPPLKREQTKEFAKDRTRQLMGENSNIFFAQDKGIYKGEIIGLTPTYAIQKLNGETAILHRLKDLASASVESKDAQNLLREGQDVSIVKDGSGVSITPWSKEREDKEKIREREKTRGSQSR